MLKVIGWGLVVLLLLAAGALGYSRTIGNERVADDIRQNPDGDRARRTLLLTFSDGRMIPVNFLREDGLIYLGSDGPWWRRFQGEGEQVTMEVRGETVIGKATVVLDDPARTADVFSRLRPTAPSWLPDWLNGKLVVIEPSAE